MRDRIAVSSPRGGVKVWIWQKGKNAFVGLSRSITQSLVGTWVPQRSILRQNVTAIRFIEGGEALVGGTRDGVV